MAVDKSLVSGSTTMLVLKLLDENIIILQDPEKKN